MDVHKSRVVGNSCENRALNVELKDERCTARAGVQAGEKSRGAWAVDQLKRKTKLELTGIKPHDGAVEMEQQTPVNPVRA